MAAPLVSVASVRVSLMVSTATRTDCGAGGLVELLGHAGDHRTAARDSAGG